MKASMFDRFLLIVWMLLGMAAGVALLLMAFGVFSLDAALAGLETYAAGIGGLNFSLLVGCVGVAVFFVSLRLIIGFNKRPKEQKAPPQTAVVISTGDYGTTQITLAAIDAMVQRHCRANGKVREATSVVGVKEGGVAISLKLALLSDAMIPEVTSGLRTSMKEYLEGLTGIQVNDISIVVVSAPTQQALQK